MIATRDNVSTVMRSSAANLPVATYIANLDAGVKATVSLISKQTNAGYWLMKVHLYYEGKSAGTTSFTLRGYSQEEAEEIACNLPNNAFLLREIDAFLWGDSD